MKISVAHCFILPGDFLFALACIRQGCRGSRGEDGRDMETPLAKFALGVS